MVVSNQTENVAEPVVFTVRWVSSELKWPAEFWFFLHGVVAKKQRCSFLKLWRNGSGYAKVHIVLAAQSLSRSVERSLRSRATPSYILTNTNVLQFVPSPKFWKKRFMKKWLQIDWAMLFFFEQANPWCPLSFDLLKKVRKCNIGYLTVPALITVSSRFAFYITHVSVPWLYVSAILRRAKTAEEMQVEEGKAKVTSHKANAKPNLEFRRAKVATEKCAPSTMVDIEFLKLKISENKHHLFR